MKNESTNYIVERLRNFNGKSLLHKYDAEAAESTNIKALREIYPKLVMTQYWDNMRGIVLKENGQFAAIMQVDIATRSVISLCIADDFLGKGLGAELLYFACSEDGCNMCIDSSIYVVWHKDIDASTESKI